MTSTSLDKTLNVGFALALTFLVSHLANPQPASAQLFELASGALSLLTGSKNQPAPQPIIQPQPIPVQNRNLTLGTSNFNGNSMNLCLSGCVPNASVPNASIPRPVPNSFPVSPGPVGIPTQSSIATSTMRTQTGTLPPGAMVRPGVPLPPQAVPVPPQPQPRRPVLSIPPISLPINF